MLRGRVVGLGLGRALAGDKSLPIPLRLTCLLRCPNNSNLYFKLYFKLYKYLGVVDLITNVAITLVLSHSRFPL